MIDAEVLRPALAHLASDGFIAYPTETVWGLGACADRPRAVERLTAWKGRGENAPMSVLVRSVEAALELGCRVAGPALRLADEYWPGPLTLVVPGPQGFAAGVERADRAIGLRCSSHPLAHALAVAVDEAGLGPLTSTSLNRSGEAPAADLGAARELVPGGDSVDFGEPWLVSHSGYDAAGATPSSVVDCTGPVPKVLRAGAIDSRRLEETWSRSERPSRTEKVQ